MPRNKVARKKKELKCFENYKNDFRKVKTYQHLHQKQVRNKVDYVFRSKTLNTSNQVVICRAFNLVFKYSYH